MSAPPGVALAQSPATSPEATRQIEAPSIRITVGDRVLTARLADNDTARDFVSLLPLTLTMDDWLDREKTAQLPKAISTAGPRSYTYAVGDVILWSPRPSVAIFYRHDGQEIPRPGAIAVGKIESGVEMLNVPGAVTVTFAKIER